MKLQQHIMKTRKIEQLNEALFILRHFINLSARLLPFLDELSKKNNPTSEEIEDRNKIIQVFLNYQFDTKSSEILMDSEILTTIRKTFSSILHKSNEAQRLMADFLDEHNRLRKKWKFIDAN
jgi:hypothetical protein